MKDDSLIHRALAMGAAALAIFGGVGLVASAPYQPPLYSNVAITNSDEQRGQEVAAPISHFQLKEVPAGTPPTETYCVQLSGPNFLKDVHVAVPVHLANPFTFGRPSVLPAFVGTPLGPSATQEPRMSISYQPREGDPLLRMSASAEELNGLVANWSINPVDVGATGVTDIKITPARKFTGSPPILTFDRVPQEKGTASHQGESAPDPAKILDILASSLTIAAVVAEQVKKRHETKHIESPSTARTEYRVEDGVLVLADENGARETVLTSDDLAASHEDDKRLISTWAASIQTYFNLWTSIYPKRQSSPDPAINAQVEKRLDELQHCLCADLTRLKQFVEGTGRKLAGFHAVEAVCQG
jgi:hypothetical protein